MKNTLQKIWSGIKYFLKKYDAVWSAPILVAVAFSFLPSILRFFFGRGTAEYDASFFSAVVISLLVVIVAVNGAVMGLYFTIRGFHRYIYGQKMDNGTVINKSKEDWQNLSPWQRFKITLSALAFLVSSILVVYISIR